MKKFLSILVILITINLVTYSQCEYLQCNNTTLISNDVSNTSYNGDNCFISYTPVIIANSVNFNNFTQLGFNGKFTVNQTLNLNNQSKLFSIGDNTFNRVHMTGQSKIFVDGLIVINNLVANNSSLGQENTIYTNQPVIVDGITYNIGDTIRTSNGTGNYVLIKSCVSQPLPLDNIELYNKDNIIYWSSDIERDLEASTDGVNWKNILIVSGKGSIKRNNNYNFYRLDKIILKLKKASEDNVILYDFFTRKRIDKPSTFYVEKSNTQTKKIIIIK